MNTFSFEQFDVADANRAAYETCRDVAALRYAGPRPVLLLGPEQSGKTHLLWAIVKRVRAGAVQASLALVMAHEFPEKVRALVKDASPIRGKPAVFLVDELDQFQENAADLEAVTRLFLEYGHQVVIASSVHPDRLASLSREFRSLLHAGRIIEIEPRWSVSAAAASEPGEADGAALAEARATLERAQQENDVQRREIAQLRAIAEALGKERDTLEAKLAEKARSGGELVELRERASAAEAERDRIAAALSELREELAAREAAAEEHAKALAVCEAERAAAVEQRDLIEKQLSEAWQRAAKVDRLRELLAEAREDAAAAFAQQARLQGEVGALKFAVEELESVRAERDAAREFAAQLEARGREALDRFNALRGMWLASFSALRERLARTDDSGGEAWSGLPGDDDFASEMMEEARAAQGRLQVALDAAQARLRAVEAEIEALRQERIEQNAVIEALRDAAARAEDGSSHGQDDRDDG